MKYKGFKIIEEEKAINHKYDKRKTYKIKTSLWFKNMEFLSLKELYKFIDKEVLK